MTDDSSPDFLHDRYYSKGSTRRNNQVEGTRGEGVRGKGVKGIKVSRHRNEVFTFVGEGNLENRDGRTFGGSPLMKGIKRIYRKRAMVKKPENTERPTKGLVRREEE